MVKGITVTAQANGSRKDIEDAVQLAAQGILPRVEIIELTALDDALDLIKSGKANGRQAIVLRKQ